MVPRRPAKQARFYLQDSAFTLLYTSPKDFAVDKIRNQFFRCIQSLNNGSGIDMDAESDEKLATEVVNYFASTDVSQSMQKYAALDRILRYETPPANLQDILSGALSKKMKIAFLLAMCSSSSLFYDRTARARAIERASGILGPTPSEMGGTGNLSLLVNMHQVGYCIQQCKESIDFRGAEIASICECSKRQFQAFENCLHDRKVGLLKLKNIRNKFVELKERLKKIADMGTLLQLKLKQAQRINNTSHQMSLATKTSISISDFHLNKGQIWKDMAKMMYNVPETRDLDAQVGLIIMCSWDVERLHTYN